MRCKSTNKGHLYYSDNKVGITRSLDQQPALATKSSSKQYPPKMYLCHRFLSLSSLLLVQLYNRLQLLYNSQKKVYFLLQWPPWVINENRFVRLSSYYRLTVSLGPMLHLTLTKQFFVTVLVYFKKCHKWQRNKVLSGYIESSQTDNSFW